MIDVRVETAEVVPGRRRTAVESFGRDRVEAIEAMGHGGTPSKVQVRHRDPTLPVGATVRQ